MTFYYFIEEFIENSFERNQGKLEIYFEKLYDFQIEFNRNVQNPQNLGDIKWEDMDLPDDFPKLAESVSSFRKCPSGENCQYMMSFDGKISNEEILAVAAKTADWLIPYGGRYHQTCSFNGSIDWGISGAVIGKHDVDVTFNGNVDFYPVLDVSYYIKI